MSQNKLSNVFGKSSTDHLLVLLSKKRKVWTIPYITNKSIWKKDKYKAGKNKIEGTKQIFDERYLLLNGKWETQNLITNLDEYTNRNNTFKSKMEKVMEKSVQAVIKKKRRNLKKNNISHKFG